ncbi:MAG: GEVED domain-containing protein, partial [Bacteroidota bacterium]
YLSKCRQGVNSPTDPRRINLLFQNDGNNNFDEVGQAAGLRFGDQSWSADFADIDNDGDMDCFVLNHYTSSLLMLNNGDGTFSDVTASSGMSAADLNLFGIQAIFRDFDNDGFVDLLISGTEQRLFHNDGDGTFTRLANPFTNNAMESFAIGDLNSDGYLDIYAGYANLFNSPSSIDDVLLMNDGGSHHFCAVLLEGTASNRNGVGARLELHGAWGIQIREVRSGEGYGIMNSFRQHFGIGAATSISKIVVKWPSGIVDEWFAPAIDQMMTLVEGSSTPQDQSITFPAIADRFSNDPPFAILATASSGLPVNFTIVSGPATINGNSVALTGELGTVIVRASQPGNNQYHPAPDQEQSFEVLQVSGPTNYCNSQGQQPWIEWISNVNFGTIDNTSFKTPYGDYTAISTDLDLGASYPITLTPSFSWPVFDEHWRVWIDWNQDGDFADANELAMEAHGLSVINETITVPLEALAGTTRMRVAMKRDAYADPCENFVLGEVEDYSVNVVNNGPTLVLNCPDDINQITAPGQNSAVINWTAPLSTSNCPTGTVNLIQTGGLANGSAFPVGTTTITYEASDDCGLTASCSFDIIVIDGGAPVLSLTCPGNLTFTAASGASSAIAFWTPPSPTSTCPTGNINLLQTAGQNTGSSFPIGTTTIAYEASDNCENVEVCSFIVTVLENVSPPGSYCNASGQTPWVEWISNVNFGSIDNTSFKESYGDFTDLSTEVNRGESYPIVLSHSFSWNGHDEYWRVWIDWNQDNDFDDAGEEVLSEISLMPPLGTTLVSTNALINIPATAIPGATRMRVAMQRGAFAEPCETFQNGEVEDYTIDIVDNGPVLSLTCSENITIEAAQGANSATVTWETPSSSTTCPTGSTSLTQTSGPASGSNFPLGTTTIIYEAMDDCDNVVTCSFSVTVLEIVTNLILTCPNDITVQAAPGSNSAIVNLSIPVGTTDCPTGGLQINQTSGSANGSAFALGTINITYEAMDACGNLESCSFLVIVLPNNANGPTYCSILGEQPWQEWIGNVSFGNIDNDSGKDLYGNYTASSTVVEQGGTYAISLQALFSWSHFSEYFRVWIDWNQDGDFTDTDEQVFSGVSVSGTPPSMVAPVSGTISVPTNALTGNTRMRVAMKRGGYADPCDNFIYGEVEDYTVTILATASPAIVTVAELSWLDVQADANGPQLYWTSNTEYKNQSFDIERSRDGVNFVHWQNQVSESNTRQLMRYQMQDPNPFSGRTYYRIKVNFSNGGHLYSNVQSIWPVLSTKALHLFPNPAADFVFVDWKEKEGQAGTIQVYDSHGHLQMEQKVDGFTGQVIRLELGVLQNGWYTISVKTEKGKRVARQIFVAKSY